MNPRLKPSRLKPSILTLALVPLLVGVSCARHMVVPPVAVPAPSLSGWDAGRVIAHGFVQHRGGLPKAWPVGGTRIELHEEGRLTLWLASVRSEGHWDLLFRWHGAAPPPVKGYTVMVTTRSVTEGTGAVYAWSECSAFHLPDLPVPATSRGVLSEFPGDPLNGTVRHDAAGYYLCVSTPGVMAVVRQTERFQSWGGDLKQELTYSPPTPTPDRRWHDRPQKKRTP